MYVEAFHQTLNYLYMKGKLNQCVDKCVHLLMKIGKDKAFERLVIFEKDRISYQIGIIGNRYIHTR